MCVKSFELPLVEDGSSASVSGSVDASVPASFGSNVSGEESAASLLSDLLYDLIECSAVSHPNIVPFVGAAAVKGKEAAATTAAAAGANLNASSHNTQTIYAVTEFVLR